MLVGDFLKELKRDIPRRKNGIPGTEWVKFFRKRNSISYRIANNLQSSRKKSIKPYVLQHHFNLVEKKFFFK